MKNISKKAILMPEVLKIIIAVCCIILLIYLGAKLYGVFTASHQLDQAKATLDAIMGKAQALNEGEKAEYLITSPKGWRLLPISSEKKICICPVSSDITKQLSSCATAGVCKISNVEFNFLGNFYTCSNQGVFTSQGITGCISLDNLPKALYLQKKEGKIQLTVSDTVDTGGSTTAPNAPLSFAAEVYDLDSKTSKKTDFNYFKYSYNNNQVIVVNLFPYIYYGDSQVSQDLSGGPENAPAYLYFALARESFWNKNTYVRVWFSRLGQGNLPVGKLSSDGVLSLACDFLAYPRTDQPQYYKFSDKFVVFDDPDDSTKFRKACFPQVAGRDESYQITTNIKFDVAPIKTVLENLYK